MKNAALYKSGGEYHLYKGGAGETYPIVPPAKPELFLPILAEHAIDVLWIMPQTELSRDISWRDFERIDQSKYKIFPSKNDDSKRPGYVSLRKITPDRFEKDYYLSFPEHTEWSASGDRHWYLPAPYALGATINYLSHEFNMDVMWGPGNMGMKVLKRIHQKKGYQIPNLEMTDHIRQALNQAMVRPIWSRFGGLSNEQKQMRYIHGYDKNAQYLGAAQSCWLGGTQLRRAESREFHMGTVGFWRYELTDVSNSAFDGDDLPCPLDINRQWASTDLLLAARSVGVEFEIHEGLVYDGAKKYLEDWAKEMWKHRANLRDEEKYSNEIARENALGTAKAAANMMMGRLAKPNTREMARPDWNLEIVHKAIGNQCYSLNKFQRDYNIKPVLVCTDSFWVVSDSPDPGQGIPGILDHQKEQRGYKCIGTVPISPEIIDAFEDLSPEAINALLKKQIEEFCYA